jgi:hypothetical protein
MKIDEAVKGLTESLGIAMGGGDKSGAYDETQNVPAATNAGDSIYLSRVDMKAVGSDNTVTIKFEGEHQPEAARTVHYLLGHVLDELGLKNVKNPSRKNTEDFGGTGRKIELVVPNEKKTDFVAKVKAISEAIRTTPELQDQYRTATDFTTEHVNPIEGTKTFITLNTRNMADAGKEEAAPAPLHFDMRIEGVPVPLARQIADVMHKDVDTLEDSPSRKSPDLKTTYRGGKSVTIDLSSPESAAILDAIRTFSERISSIPARESSEISY